MRLLSICTSFRRPDQLPQMLDTYFATRGPGCEMFVYLHEDDPKLEEYKKFIQNYRLTYVIEPHRCMQEVLNHTCLERFPGIPYYQIITDDARYITPNWNNLLIDEFEKRSNGWGFICPDDRLNDDWFAWQHPSMEIWSYKQAKLLGYAYPRTVRHRGQDTFTKELCAELGLCPLVPSVIIRHLQGAMCANPDENLAEVNSFAAEREALAGLQVWRDTEKERTLRLIRGAREAECK